MTKRRKKTRTHLLRPDPTLQAKGGSGSTPKTFVIKTPNVGSSVAHLVHDMRNLLEPNTASRLKERKRNRLRDFVAMAGPLGVSHMLIFSQAPAEAGAVLSNVNMRISRMPRGPTLTFKVLRFALSQDVLAASRHPHSPGKEYATEPLLILNNFGGQERQLKLMTTVFQNLFPAIHVQSMPLTAARRVVLLSYNSDTRTIDLRHYLISVRPIGVSKPVRKLIEGSTHSRGPAVTSNQKGIPDMSRASDISEFILHHADLGYASSASEGESDVEGTSTRRVELAGNYVGRANKRITSGDQRAIKLIELGPRLELGLVKIEDGLGGNEGEVMFHELISKTPAEIAALTKKRKAREQRRKIQEAHVKAKIAAQASAQPKGKKVTLADEDEGDEEAEAVEEVAADSPADSDLFAESTGDDAEADILDQEVDEDERSSENEMPTTNPRYEERNRTKPKFSMRRKHPM